MMLEGIEKLSLFRLLAWSLRLDFELLFRVSDLPFLQRVSLIFRKYAEYLKERAFSGELGTVRSSNVFGGRYCYKSAHGLASLQRVYCAAHTVKDLVPDSAVIVDVGSNCGQFNHFSRQFLGAARVISIEPEKESYGLLRLNAAVPADSLCCAVSDIEGEVLFHVARESSQLSSYVVEDDVSYREAYSVLSRRLDDLAAEMKIEKVHLLKIDTEGSEFDVLKSAEKLLSMTDLVMVEMSIFRKCSGNLFRIGDFLEKRGFVLVELSCGSGRRPRDADAVFKRICESSTSPIVS